MALLTYVATVYVNGGQPAIDADNLNKTENQVKELTDAVLSHANVIGDLSTNYVLVSDIGTTVVGVGQIGDTVQPYDAETVVATDGVLPPLNASLLTNLPSGFADPMTTRGDIIYRNATNTTARMALGTSGQVLSSDGTDLVWATALLASDLGDTVQAYDVNNALKSHITYEQLDTNGDIGAGATQVAKGDHNHSGVYEPANANIAKTNVANVFSAVQGSTILAGANAINFTGNNCIRFTATAANITVGTMATKKGQEFSVTIDSANLATGWGTEFLFAPDFSAVTPTPPTMTGTMEFYMKVVEVNGVDGGTANKIHVAWAQ